MKGSVIALGQFGNRTAAARLVDGRLDDLLVDPGDGAPPAPGTIFCAICEKPAKGQGGMFVRLPEGTGFLRGVSGLRPGQALLVQVTGTAEPGKAVPMTQRVLFKSRYAIVTPGAPGINISRSIRDEEERVALMDIARSVLGEEDDPGLILRSSAAGADENAIAEDIAAMHKLALAVIGDADGTAPELLVDGPDAHLLAWRDWPQADLLADGPTAFEDHAIPDLVADMQAARIDLAGGYHAFLEPTRALIAVDVNTGADTSLTAGLKANLVLARDLPRQLRCRGLGGQIVIDFAPMPRKDRRQIESALRAAFKSDATETALVGWTQMGHFELQRKRDRFPLANLSLQ